MTCDRILSWHHTILTVRQERVGDACHLLDKHVRAGPRLDRDALHASAALAERSSGPTGVPRFLEAQQACRRRRRPGSRQWWQAGHTCHADHAACIHMLRSLTAKPTLVSPLERRAVRRRPLGPSPSPPWGGRPLTGRGRFRATTRRASRWRRPVQTSRASRGARSCRGRTLAPR